jgi:DNA repair ATPase RecN
MDTQIALSVGTLVACISFFYTFHKDSKEVAKQLQKLETEVDQLKEHKSDINELKQEINMIKQTLTRVDTNISHILEKR